MRKRALHMGILLIFLFAFGCGGGGGGSSNNTPVSVSVTFPGSHASSLDIKAAILTDVRYRVSGPNMRDITGVVPVVGDAVDIDLLVPTGPQRLFTLEILDGSGIVQYKGDTTVDLTGEPVNLVIPLREIPKCNDEVKEGSDDPETFTIELGKKSGTFQFEYETYSIEDRMIITYEGNVLFDSGCIGTGGVRTEYITYSGNATSVTVEVQPNCAGTTSTQWNFIVHCPTEQQQENDLVGTWAHVAIERTNDGMWGSILEKIIFRNDGTGAELNRRVDYGGIANVFERINFSYTTSQNQDGSMTLTLVYADRTTTHKIIRSDNGNMAIIDRTNDASSKRIDVAIRMDTAKSYTTADFIGDYYAAGYNYDTNAFFSPGVRNAFASVAFFDGAGEYTLESTSHSDEIIYTNSQVAPYAVTDTDGAILTAGYFNGYLGRSGLFLTSNPTNISDCWRLTFGMPRGDMIYSTASLAGTWALVGFGDANEGSSYGDIVGTMTCNTTGNCQAILKHQKDGDVVSEQIDLVDIPVDPDGSFGYFPNAISPPYGSAIGNNGNTITMNMSFGQSELYDREVLIGVRCSTCSNLAGQGITVKTKKVYQFKKTSRTLTPQKIKKQTTHRGKIG